MATAIVDPATDNVATQSTLTTVTEGYYPYSTVAFHWPAALEPRAAWLVTGIVKDLWKSSHPLVREGQQHVDLYICELKDGTKIDCLSLQQVQYIQYIIFESRWLDLAFLDYTTECKYWKEGLPRPRLPPVDPTIKPVPLPSEFIPASCVTRVETEPINTISFPRSRHNQLKKENKQHLRDRALGLLPSADNGTPITLSSTLELGDSTPSTRSTALEELEPATLPPPSSALQVEDGGIFTEQGTECTADEDPKTTGEDQDNDLLLDDDGLNDDSAEDDGIDLDTMYFVNSRNAYFSASAGGVHGMLNSLGQTDDIEATMGERNPSVGRGLFIAVDVRFNEIDGTYLEAGYSACWWENPPTTETPDTYVDGDTPEMNQVLRRKHWRVNSTANPAIHPDVDGGSTISIDSANLERTLDREIATLWSLSGRGAIYVITHSPDRRTHGVRHINADTFNNSGSVHLTAAGKGQRYLLDIAQLVNSIENGNGREASPRSLSEVVGILYPDEDASFDAQHTNTGNYAYWLWTAFESLIELGSSYNEACAEFHHRHSLYALKKLRSKVMDLGMFSDFNTGGNDDDDDSDEDGEAAIARYFGELDDDVDSDFEGVTVIPEPDDDDE